MPITVDEHPSSRGGTDTQLKRKYNVFGTQDEAAAIAAVLTYAPAALGSLLHKTVSLEEINSEDPTGGCYFAEVAYSAVDNEPGNDPEKASTAEYRFNFQAPSVHIYQSLATIVAAKSPTIVGVPPFYGAINVVLDGGSLKVEGFNLAPPPETFTLTYYDESGFFDDDFKDTLEAMVGKVNNAEFKGRPAGSLCLCRAAGGGPVGILSSMDLGFSFIQNQTDIPVGDITIPAKDGQDLLWAYYEDAKDEDDEEHKCLIRKPVAAYVERIRYRADFNDLGI